MDNQTVAEAAAGRDLQNFPGRWMIEPYISSYLQLIDQKDARVFKIDRKNNSNAHRQAQRAYGLHDVGTCLLIV